MFKALFNLLDGWFKRAADNRRDLYLASCADPIELEHRIRQWDKKARRYPD